MESTPFIPPGLTKNEIIKPITKPAKSAIQSCPVPNKKLKATEHSLMPQSMKTLAIDFYFSLIVM